MDSNQLMSGPAVGSLVRRGLSPNLLMQNSPMATGITPGSPNFDPSLANQSAPSMPSGSPMTGAAPMPAPQPPMQPPMPAPAAPKFTPLNEPEHIVQALTKRLDSLNKLVQTPGKSDATEEKQFDAGAQTIKQDFMSQMTNGHHPAHVAIVNKMKEKGIDGLAPDELQALMHIPQETIQEIIGGFAPGGRLAQDSAFIHGGGNEANITTNNGHIVPR